jgi:hypothetical protein
LRLASQHATRAEAQANARLALMLAMGQLQQAAGPDQRVTTTADQWTTGGDGSSSSAASGQRNWTGVYRAWLTGQTQRPTPEFLSWLVSGPATGTNGITSREAAANAPANEFVLVDQGTLGSATAGRVTVPTLPLAGSRGNSRLAWWTGDQGVKAGVGLPAAPGDRSPAWVRAGLQAARAFDLQLASSATGQRPFAALGSEDTRRNLIAHWPQAAFLADNPASHGGLFHDFTAYSSGMLTNVRAGGFRKDLSMFLERTPAAAPRDPLYLVNNIPGINFAELWLFYNIYKELDLQNYAFTTGGASGANTPGFQMAPNQAAFQNDHASFYTQPAIVSYKAVVSLIARSVTVNGAPRQRLGIVIDPIITFWNPLDVPISISPAYLSVKYWQFPYNITLQVGSRTITSSIRRLLGDEHYLTLVAGRTQPIVLKPGEVLVYSQASKTQPVYDTPGLNFLQGTAGWNFGGGMAIDIRDTSNAFVHALPTDTVRYSLQPNNEVSMGSQHWYLVGFGNFYKEDRASRGESVGLGANSVDSRSGNPYFGSVKPTNLRLRASAFPNVFPSFSTTATRPLLVSQLSGRKEPIIMYSHNMKTEFSSDRGGRWLSRFNPQPMSFDFSTLSNAERDLLPFEVQVDILDSWKNRNLEVTTTGTGFFGGGWTADLGTSYLVTHTVPLAGRLPARFRQRGTNRRRGRRRRWRCLLRCHRTRLGQYQPGHASLHLPSDRQFARAIRPAAGSNERHSRRRPHPRRPLLPRQRGPLGRLVPFRHRARKTTRRARAAAGRLRFPQGERPVAQHPLPSGDFARRGRRPARQIVQRHPGFRHRPPPDRRRPARRGSIQYQFDIRGGMEGHPRSPA